MDETKEHLEHLRLLKAFLSIKDLTLRRAITKLVERTARATSEKTISGPHE